jgi:hypothetical protein
MLLDLMKSGSYFYKHDFGRNKRSRKVRARCRRAAEREARPLSLRAAAERDARGAQSVPLCMPPSILFFRRAGWLHAGASQTAPFCKIGESECVTLLLLLHRLLRLLLLFLLLPPLHPLLSLFAFRSTCGSPTTGSS